ncbi:MAG TPA: ABC transporter substrate-binding protein, partial [Candidatus Binatia bacterium]|nr:ABC transporter substrate-binding protein [Candidatus Binatia bacterium]
MKRLAFIFTIAALLALAGNAAAQRVRLGVAGISGTNAHPYVSKQLGLYQKYNIDMELIAFQGGSQLIQAMLAGDIPLSFSEGVTALATDIRNPQIYFIGGVVNIFPFTILAKPEIQRPGDLRGKKIAISRFGSSSDVAVRTAVERYNLKAEDVIILQVGGQSERFAALRSGVVDAAIVSPPFNLVGRKLGFKEVIDVSETGAAYAHQQIVARKDFIDGQPEFVMRILRATIEGLGYWKDASKREAVTQSVAKFLKLDAQKEKDQLDETFRYYGRIFPAKPYATVEGLELAAAILKKA